MHGVEKVNFLTPELPIYWLLNPLMPGSNKKVTHT